MLGEDSCQTLQELAESLNVGKTTVFDRLKAIGMIQKQGNWLLHELKERDVDRETVTGDRNRRQIGKMSDALRAKRPEYAQRHDKVILQHNNARPHVAKIVKERLEQLHRDVLPYPPYSPDIAPSDYHLFRSMQNHLSKKRFQSFAEVENVKVKKKL